MLTAQFSRALLLVAAIAASAPVPVGASRNSCRFSQRDFIGYWEDRASAGDDSQELQFTVENGRHVFRSWLHHRPDAFGTWTFADCQMKVEGPAGMELTYRFKANDKRRLIEVESGSIYRRIR